MRNKKPNAVKEKDIYTKYHNLNFTEKAKSDQMTLSQKILN